MSESLSQIIVDAMRRYGLDAERLSELTGISERFIADLLEEKLTDLPSAPYVRGYLKKISEALNLNGEEIWRAYLKDRQEIRRSGSGDKLPANRFALASPLKRFLTVIVVIFVIVAGYFLLRSGGVFGQVGIRLADFDGDSPVAYRIWPEPDYTFRGNVAPLSSLTMNGSPLYPDSEGYFETTVRLQPGLNNFEFRAKKLLGRENSRTAQIFYQISPANGQ